MKKIFESIRAIFEWIALFVGVKSGLTNEAVNVEICDFSGQGRNRYGD